MSDYDPNYVEEKVFVRVGMKSVVYNPEGKILILKRSDKTRRAGGWDLPGGALDKGEDPTQGAIREIEEESGLKVTKAYPIMTSAYWPESPEDPVITIAFKALSDDDVVTLSWEHTEYQWLEVDEALQLDMPEWLLKFIRASLKR